jgi:hypothetical protein
MDSVKTRAFCTTRDECPDISQVEERIANKILVKTPLRAFLDWQLGPSRTEDTKRNLGNEI